jgi:hypothetical protein
MLTAEEAVRKQAQEEIGDLAEKVQNRKLREALEFMILQKYGVAKPVLDKRIDNPGWVPETSTEAGSDTWKRRKTTWLSQIKQARRAAR